MLHQNYVILRDHSFSMYAKFSEKHTRAYQGVLNVSCSKNFVYVLNEWFLSYYINKNNMISKLSVATV